MTMEKIQQEVEPVEILHEMAIIRLKELFPGKNVERIVDSFLMDILYKNNIPSTLDGRMPEKQMELLRNGAATLEESITAILADIPDELIDFYRKKLENPTVKNFDIL